MLTWTDQLKKIYLSYLKYSRMKRVLKKCQMFDRTNYSERNVPTDPLGPSLPTGPKTDPYLRSPWPTAVLSIPECKLRPRTTFKLSFLIVPVPSRLQGRVFTISLFPSSNSSFSVQISFPRRWVQLVCLSLSSVSDLFVLQDPYVPNSLTFPWKISLGYLIGVQSSLYLPDLTKSIFVSSLPLRLITMSHIYNMIDLRSDLFLTYFQ